MVTFVPSFSLRRRALGAGALCALVAPALWVKAGSAAATPIRVSVGTQADSVFRHLPLVIAQQLDFFAPEGLQVTVQACASDALALQAMHSGNADVCAVDFEQILRHAHTSAAAAQCFVVQGRAAQLALGVSMRALPRFKALADLRGHRVGVCALGTQSHTVACLALVQGGVEPAAVTFVAVGDGERATAALRSGRVQALCHGDPLMTLLEQRGDVRIVGDARTLSGGQALFGGSVPGGCLVAPAAFLQKRAAAAQSLAHGIVHALKWLQTAGPADLVKALPSSSVGKERSLFLSAFARARETLSPDGLMPLDGPTKALRALVLAEPDMAMAQHDLARTFALDFAQKAKLKFSA